METKDEVFETWWPLPRSIDLVKAPFDRAAPAIFTELDRFTADEPLRTTWDQLASVDELFRSVPYFASVPTIYYIVPTHSDWTAIVNNCFMCDGHDLLCWNLTKVHHLTTLAWASSDRNDVFQAGSHFTYRAHDGNNIITRSVHCSRQDEDWHSFEMGDPLAEEDIKPGNNEDRRLDEKAIVSLLEKLGARPWREDFYNLGADSQCYRVERPSPPITVIKRYFDEIRYRG